MVWVSGCGAGEQHASGGELREAGPHLLPVDDPVVAVLDRPGGQRCQVATRAGLGKALTPLLFTAQQQRHHFRREFWRGVVDHRRREYLEHRVRPRLGETATHHFLADDRAQQRRPAQPPDLDGPAVSHPVGVVQGPADPGELLHMALQRVVGPRGQVVLVEPCTQTAPELLDIHGAGRPMACGRPESCTPLRRINVMARVLSRQPSAVRR